MAATLKARVWALGSLILGACTTLSPHADWTVTKNAATGKLQTGPAEAELVYAVAAAALPEELRDQGHLLLVQETLPVSKQRSLTFPQDYAGFHRYLAQVNKACVEAFLKVNKARLQLGGEPPPQLRLAPISRVNLLLQSGGWKALLGAYPKTKALVSAARPGLCAKQSEALLFLLSTHGDGGADSLLVQAKREGSGDWRVAKQVVIARAEGLDD